MLTDVNKRINEQLRIARDQETCGIKRAMYQVSTNGRALSNKSVIANMTQALSKYFNEWSAVHDVGNSKIDEGTPLIPPSRDIHR